MKLIRFGEPGQERPGIIDAHNQRKDLSASYLDWDRNFFGKGGIQQLSEYIATNPSLPNVDDDVRWGACIARPGKVICIGLNYSDHATESGMAIPEEPIVFQKGANTVVGPYDPILIPRNSEKTDWEIELGVVIGQDARYLNSEGEAWEHIAGFCLVNDVSERAFQLERGGQWTKGKSCDNFTPTGPYLVTPDEIPDIQNMDMLLTVNGKPMQKGNTKNMIFGVNHVIHYLSQFMTLEAGDLVLTGTPHGVGLGMKPPTYLEEGDIVALSIEELGLQQQICIKA